MSDIVKIVKDHLRVKEVSLDNGVFKLFSVGSVILCLLGSILCAATQYFGEPITCEFDGSINGDFAKRYCWIHGSSWIGKAYQDDFDCITAKEYPEGEAPDTSYYQWVVFFLLVQSWLFLLPYKLWKFSERGLIRGFVTDQSRSSFALCDDEDNEKSKRSRDLVKTFVRQFKSILHHNTRYFATFVACELLNVAFLVANFHATDVFLNGNFATYGLDVLHYYQSNSADHLPLPNPMCQAFPTKVSCTLRIVAAGGGNNMKNGLCILSQNIVNEKVFLVLYFWYVLLFVVAGFFALYRTCTILLPQFRRWTILAKVVRGSNHRGVEVAVGRVLGACQVGDWFVLNQIGKNVDPYFFREFVKELQNEVGSAAAAGNGEGVCLVKYQSGEGDNDQGKRGQETTLARINLEHE